MAYEHQSQTDFYIQAVEKTELLVITQKNQELLLSQFPQLERYFRFVYQRAYAATQMRIKYIFSLAKDEFYFQLLKKHPEFVQRVPQYLIASFLGFYARIFKRNTQEKSFLNQFKFLHKTVSQLCIR